MYKEIEKSLIKEFKYTIYHPFIKALNQYYLLKENDNVMVCISGGKDSFVLAKCFQELHRYSKFPFSVHYVLMDPGYDNSDLERIKRNAEILNVPLEIFNTNIFKVSTSFDKNKCYMCAKMRRGALYQKATELGCNKIALGHHFNDVIETTMMGLLYEGQFETMIPKLKSEHFENMELIRPLYLVKEESIIEFAKFNNLEFLKCGCFLTKNTQLCESSKRQKMKALIKELKKDNDNVDMNIFKSIDNVNLSKLLGYTINREHYSNIKEDE